MEWVRDPAKGKWPEVVKPKKKLVELGDQNVGSLTRTDTGERAHQAEKTAVTVTCFPGGGGQDDCSRSVPDPGTPDAYHGTFGVEGRPGPTIDHTAATTASDLPIMMAAEIVDVPVEEEALPAEEALLA
jgi:hypothetical protein